MSIEHWAGDAPRKPDGTIDVDEYKRALWNGDVFWRWKWSVLPFTVALEEWHRTATGPAIPTGRSCTMSSIQFVLGRLKHWRMMRRIPRARVVR